MPPLSNAGRILDFAINFFLLSLSYQSFTKTKRIIGTMLLALFTRFNRDYKWNKSTKVSGWTVVNEAYVVIDR